MYHTSTENTILKPHKTFEAFLVIGGIEPESSAYRYWHILTKESSKEIYAQAPAKTMNTNYLMFHTRAPELAIEDLKELHQQKKHSKNKK